MAGDGNSGRLIILKPTLSLAWNISLSCSRLLPTRSRVLIVRCSDCTWIHAGPTIRQRKQKTRQISQHSTWRAIVSISRNSIFLSSRMPSLMDFTSSSVHRESVHKTLVLEISTTAISSRYGRPLLPMSIFSRIRD